MSKYLLRIEPVEHFFFGVEKTGDLGNRKPYYMRTALFPQQTSILGLLRYILLLKNNLLGTNLNTIDVEKLIGIAGFPGVKPSKDKSAYGKIINIFPVFILGENNRAYYYRPLDWKYKYEKITNCKVSYNNDNCVEFVPFLKDYDAKKGIPEYVISQNGDSLLLEYNGESTEWVLRKEAKAGNQKSPERRFVEKKGDKKQEDDAKKEAYYKQEFLYMSKGFAYGCIVEVENEHGLDEYKTVLPFGGERSSFSISFVELNDDSQYKFNLDPPQNKELKIELLSDTYMDNADLNHACFAICDAVAFRNLKTSTKTKNYNMISDDIEDGIELSSRLQLLKKGSVFFFESDTKLGSMETAIGKHDVFTTIGYNKIRTFK